MTEHTNLDTLFLMKLDATVALNQKDAYVIGRLVIAKAFSKKTAKGFSPSYLASAEKLVSCGCIQKYRGKYWLN